jgi:peptidyl-prolyl cis-trans isomerase SurA
MAVIILLMGVFLSKPLLGQQEIDRIVAVVGSEVILLSELRESVILAARQLNIAPDDSTRLGELESEILNGMVEEKVILQRARVEGIEIPEEALDTEVEKDLEKVISRFPSRSDFEVALATQGLDLYTYKEQLRKEKEKQLIQQRFMQMSQMPYVRVTEEEARTFFDENFKDKSIKPPSVELREIILDIKLDESHLAAARERAIEARMKIEEGQSYESIVEDITRDENMRAQFGDLGMVKESDLLPEIFDAVDLLLPGEISLPIETAQGIHIFKVEERKGNQVRLSHLLFQGEAGKDPFKETMALAEELKKRIDSGDDFGAIAESHNSDEALREKRGERGEEMLEGLPEAFRSVVDAMEPGDVSDPFVVEDQVVILQLKSRSPARPYKFEEVKDQLIESLAQEKSYQRFVEELEAKTYINIRL